MAGVAGMTEARTDPWLPNRRHGDPLVLAICANPLLAEAVGAALDGVAAVRGFPAGRGDTADLVERVAPEAVVVDTEAEALALEALPEQVSLVHVVLETRRLRCRKDGGWEEIPNPENSLALIRNVVFGELLAATRGRRTGRESQ